MITPKDIETKVFSTGLKGYRREEVDQFLDELMVEVQSLIQENNNLKSNIEDLRKEVENRKESESSIMRTLEQAKSLMSDISASAEKRAEAIIRNAQADAARLIQDARDSVASINEEGDTIRERVSDFRERYRAMLKSELKKVEDEAGDFFKDHKDDFYPASMDDQTTDQRTSAPAQPDVQEVFEEPAPENSFAAPAMAAAAAEAAVFEAPSEAEPVFEEPAPAPEEFAPAEEPVFEAPAEEPVFEAPAAEEPAAVETIFEEPPVFPEEPVLTDPAVEAGLFGGEPPAEDPEAMPEILEDTEETDDFLRSIQDELETLPGDVGNTLQGMPAQEFGNAAVDDMAKTIVIDSEEMAKLSREN